MGSLVPGPSHPSFYLAAFSPRCEIKAGVGRTGNEARLWAQISGYVYSMYNDWLSCSDSLSLN